MRRCSLIALLFVVMLATVAHSANYGVDPASTKDTVYFRSSAKLEFIEGTSTKLDGGFSVDPANTASGVSGIFRVDLRTLRTGIEMRDEHMRTKHLETDKFPFAYLQITSIGGLPPSLDTGKTYSVTGAAMFYIHGSKRAIQLSTEVVRRSKADGTDALTTRTRFAMNLDEFGISRPKALFLKLAETINLEVIFTSYNNLAPAVIALPDWPERK
jgi:polyisoprenoid-binding protein YceI